MTTRNKYVRQKVWTPEAKAIHKNSLKRSNSPTKAKQKVVSNKTTTQKSKAAIKIQAIEEPDDKTQSEQEDENDHPAITRQQKKKL